MKPEEVIVGQTYWYIDCDPEFPFHFRAVVVDRINEWGDVYQKDETSRLCYNARDLYATERQAVLVACGVSLNRLNEQQQELKRLLKIASEL